MAAVYLVICFFLGVIFDALVRGIFTNEPKTDGAIRVYTSDPDGPYMFLEIKNVDDILRKQRVVLDVHTDETISQ